MNAETILVAALVSIVAPSIQSYFVNRGRRVEKREDWKRQDDVAAKAEEAARLLLASNKDIAKTAARVAKETNSKLEVIRVDVNSNMTAAMKAELDATVAQLILMRENVELKKTSGVHPGADVIALIFAKEERINELKAILKDRLTHTDDAAAAAAAAALVVDSQT